MQKWWERRGPALLRAVAVPSGRACTVIIAMPLPTAMVDAASATLRRGQIHVYA